MRQPVRVLMPGQLGISKEAKARQLREKQEKVRADYLAFIERRPQGVFYDLCLLPHPKEQIVDAFLNSIANSESKQEIEYHALSIMTLGSFQPSVGSEPLSLPDAVSHIENLDEAARDELFGQIDHDKFTHLIQRHSADLSSFRKWIEKAIAENRHLLPWHVKLWHRFRQQGAFDPFADEFVTITYKAD